MAVSVNNFSITITNKVLYFKHLNFHINLLWYFMDINKDKKYVNNLKTMYLIIVILVVVVVPVVVVVVDVVGDIHNSINRGQDKS